MHNHCGNGQGLPPGTEEKTEEQGTGQGTLVRVIGIPPGFSCRNCMYICAKIRDYDDRNTPLLDTWKSFSDLVSTGKVKKVGISNYSPQRMAELAHIILEYSLAPIDFVQLKYSVIDPVKDADFGKLVLLNPEMRETLARLLPKAVIFAYSPLLGGAVFEKTAKDNWPSEYDSTQNRGKVVEIQLKAKELGVSPSAYVLEADCRSGYLSDHGYWKHRTSGIQSEAFQC